MQQWKYTIRECIGKGSYGDVYLGIDKENGSQVALKVIDLEDVEDDIEDIHKEITMLAGCRCKNITEYHGSLLKPGSTELMIVMELMACSVADLVQHGPLDESFVAYILHEVLGALAYLHSENRIHRDIKAANILLGPTGGVKISDFGVSGQLSGTMGYRRRTFVGTPFWMAPEVIESSEEGYTELADIWSLGITAMEMATGSPPYSDLHPMRVLFLIPKNPPPKLEGNFSPEFKDFVNRCMQKDPSARPPAAELLQHPFVAACKDAAPEGLGEMVHEYSSRRGPVASRRESSHDCTASTLPGWDFGTKKFGRSTQKMGDTLKAAVVDRYMQGKPNATDVTAKSNGATPHQTVSNKGMLEEATSLSDDLQTLRDLPTGITANGNGQQHPSPSDTNLHPTSSGSLLTTGHSSHSNTQPHQQPNSHPQPHPSNHANSRVQSSPSIEEPRQSPASVSGQSRQSLKPSKSVNREPLQSLLSEMQAGEAEEGWEGEGEGMLPLPTLPPWGGALGAQSASDQSATSQSALSQSQAGNALSQSRASSELGISTSGKSQAQNGVAVSSQGMSGASVQGNGTPTAASAFSLQQQQQQADMQAASISQPNNQPSRTSSSGHAPPLHSSLNLSGQAGLSFKRAISAEAGSAGEATRPASATQGSTGGTLLPPRMPHTASSVQGQQQQQQQQHKHNQQQQQQYKEQPSTSEGNSGGDAYATFRETDKYATVQSRQTPSRNSSQQEQQGMVASSSRGDGQADRHTLQAVTQRTDPAFKQESLAVLGQVLLPSLRSVIASQALSDNSCVQQLSQSLESQLSQLEKMLPGTSAHLLQQLLVKLVASTDPALDALKAVASSLLISNPLNNHHSQQQVGGGSTLLPPRAVGSLGPLGEFLLGKWQEDVVSEQALLARGSHL